MSHWFDELQRVIGEYNIIPKNIYNIDESSFCWDGEIKVSKRLNYYISTKSDCFKQGLTRSEPEQRIENFGLRSSLSTQIDQAAWDCPK